MGHIEQAGGFSSASTIHLQASQVLLSQDCFKRRWKLLRFPGGLVGKECACNAGDRGSTPGLTAFRSCSKRFIRINSAALLR